MKIHCESTHQQAETNQSRMSVCFEAKMGENLS